MTMYDESQTMCRNRFRRLSNLFLNWLAPQHLQPMLCNSAPWEDISGVIYATRSPAGNLAATLHCMCHRSRDHRGKN